MRTFHTFEQHSPMWYLIRIPKLTSSNIHRIMAQGKGAETYYDEIMLKIDLLIDVHESDVSYEEAFAQFNVKTRAMAVGNDFEPLAITDYMHATGNVVEPVGFIEFDNHPIGASTDGLVGEDGIVEAKNPNSIKHRATMRAGVMPKEHVVQVQSEIWIAGKQFCDFISYDYRRRSPHNLFVERILRDESKIQEIMDVAIPFAERLPKNPFDFDLSEIEVTGRDVIDDGIDMEGMP